MSARKTTATKPKVQRKGAPSKYSDALATRICAEIAAGRSVASICKDPGLPSKRTFFDWLRDKPEFKALYVAAKLEGVTALAEEILEIADDSSNDYIEVDEGLKFNHEHVQRARLRIDTRRWLMGKLLPSQWGDKVDIHHGTVAGDPLQQLITAVQGQTFGPVQKASGEDEED